jgi:hypothetical protein
LAKVNTSKILELLIFLRNVQADDAIMRMRIISFVVLLTPVKWSLLREKIENIQYFRFPAEISTYFSRVSI